MTLDKLIETIVRVYNLTPRLGVRAIERDPRALKAIGTLVGMLPAKIPPADLLEACAWGVNWGASRYTELHKWQTK